MSPIQLFKKSAILIIGITVILIGIALLVLPGPGLVVIAFGLFILSTEFAWAERRLAKLKAKSKELLDKTKSTKDDR